MADSGYDPYSPDNTRTQYTGAFAPQVDTPLSAAGQAAVDAKKAKDQSQLAGVQNGANYGYTPGVPSGTKSDASSAAAPAMNPWNMTNLGGMFSFTNAQNVGSHLYQQGENAWQRGAPTINTGAQNMFAQGVGNSIDAAQRSNLYGAQALQTADRTNLYGMQNALDLRALAGGQAVGGQMGLAGQLQALGQMPAGPSVAEQQLKMGADRSMQQQMAMAAGARGGNAGLALQTAAAQQGQTMGDLNQQQALLRAQEDVANRQLAANTLQGAANVYNQAGAAQQSALAGAANVTGNVAANQVAQGQGYSNIAGNQVNQANTNAALVNTYASQATDQAKLQAAQTAMNDQLMLGSEQMGTDVLDRQRQAEMALYFGDEQNALGNRALDIQYKLGKDAQNNQFLGSLLGGVGAAGGALAGFFAGGPAGAAAGGYGGYELGKGIGSSDIRKKKDIAPAEQEIGDAYRTIGVKGRAPRVNDLPGYDAGEALLPASSSSYFYRNPGDTGAAPGRHYGPMAQELEQTPAGRSVVTRMPDGSKGIDTGRLSLLTASAAADMRREIDAIKSGQADRYFGPGYTNLHTGYHEDRSGNRIAHQVATGPNGETIVERRGSPMVRGVDENGNVLWGRFRDDALQGPSRKPAPLDAWRYQDPTSAMEPYFRTAADRANDPRAFQARAPRMNRIGAAAEETPAVPTWNTDILRQPPAAAAPAAVATSPRLHLTPAETRATYQGIDRANETADDILGVSRRARRLSALDAQNNRDAQTLAQIEALDRRSQLALSQPTTQPAYGGYGPF